MHPVKATPEHLVTLLALVGLSDLMLRSVRVSKDRVVIETNKSKAQFRLDYYSGWFRLANHPDVRDPHRCDDRLSEALFDALVHEGYRPAVCRQLKGKFLWKHKEALKALISPL